MLVLSINSLNAQQVVPCGFDANREELIQNYGEEYLAKELEISTFLNTNNLINARVASRIASQSTYYIPVVFHDLTGGAVQYGQVTSQIAALNNFFSNPETNIRFCIAQFDINGNSIGISGQVGLINYGTNYGMLAGTSSEYQNQVLNNVGNSVNLFPATNYLNIYIYENIVSANAVLGFAPNPLGSNFLGVYNPLDGIVLDRDVLGAGSGWGLLPNYNQGKILAHEIGHYFFLLHTFTNECNAPGDYVNDTQPCKGNSTFFSFPDFYDCNSSSPDESCGATFNQKSNFMNYSTDNCANTFTANQISRMLLFIESNRTDLVSNLNMIRTGINTSTSCECPNNLLVPEFTINQNAGPYCLNTNYTFSAFNSSFNSAISYQWSITNLGGIGGFTIISGALTSNQITLQFTQNSPFSISLTVTDANGLTSNYVRQIRIRDCSGAGSISEKTKANWYFGNGAKINFNNGIPIGGMAACQNSANYLKVSESVEAISNEQGQLLFYTDGNSIWDYNENLVQLNSMFSGSTASNNQSISQRLIVQSFSNPNEYYIISPPEKSVNTTITPSIIPRYKTVNTGNINALAIGDPTSVVSDINWLLNEYDRISELITYVPSCNSYGWIVYLQFKHSAAPNVPNCRVVAQKLDNTGLSPNLTFSEPFRFDSDGTIKPSYGSMKCSPDGKRILISGNFWTGSQTKGKICVINFDSNLGQTSGLPIFVSDALNSQDISYFYSASFAPNNSNLINVAVPTGTDVGLTSVIKFYLVGGSIFVNPYLTSENYISNHSGLQNGPDDLVYLTKLNANSISSISNADDFNQSVLVLNDIDYNGFVGTPPISSCLTTTEQQLIVQAKLPNFCDFKSNSEIKDPSIHYVLFDDCKTAIFDVMPLPPCYSGTINYAWSFGDGTTGIGATPSHEYSTDGTFDVAVTLTGGPFTTLTLYTQVTIINQSISISAINGNGNVFPGSIQSYNISPFTPDPNIQILWSVFPSSSGTIIGANNVPSIEVQWNSNPNTNTVLRCTIQSGGCTKYLEMQIEFGACNIGLTINHLGNSCTYAPIFSGVVSGGTMPFTYTWKKSNGQVFATTSLINLADFGDIWGTTISLTVIDANGCMASVTINTQDFISIPALPNLTPTTVLNNSVYYLQGNVTVDGGTSSNPVTLLGISIIALPNSSITVQGGSNFQITKSHIYACNKMWKGIDATKANFIGTNRSTLIEDAIVAIEIAEGCSYNFERTTFNLNGKALKIANTFGETQRNFYSNVVTRHNEITSWSYDPANLRIDNSNGPINNLNNMVLSALKPLSNGSVLRPEGIEITNSSVPVSIGSSASISDRNIFDALDIGIVVRNTRNVTFINNTFNNICAKWSDLTLSFGSPPIGYGSAIDAEAIAGIPTASFNSFSSTFTAGILNNAVAKNSIVNCTYGFKVKNYTDVRINLNSFTCSFNVFSSPSPSTRIWGQEAIFVSTEKLAPGPLMGTSIVAGINQNTISNFENAIRFNRQNNLPFATNNAFYINSNIINPTSIFTSNTRVRNGIILTSANNTGAIARTIIQTNNIQNVSKNGISASSYHDFDIRNNTNITLRRNLTDGSSSPYNAGFAGILLNSCTNGNVFTNCNIGIGGANTQVIPSTWEKFRGIVLFASTGIRIYRNTIRNTGQCLAFYGTCTSPHSINDNTFINSRDGIVLRDNPIIGHQGHFTNNNRGSNNFWVTGSPTPWQFPGRFMGAGNIITSQLYFNPLTGTEVLNGTGSRNPTAVGGTFQLAPFTINVYPSFSSCSGGGGVPPGYIEDVPENEEALLEAADNSSAAEGDYSEAIKWYGEKFVYEELLRASTAIAEPDLQEFFDTKTEENLGKITDVEEKLMQGNIEDAKAVNDAILAENSIEEKHKFVNDEYYKFMKHFQDSITAEDTINQFEPNYQELKELGEASPLIYGPSTNRAATLWMHYFMKSIDLENLYGNSGGRFANNEEDIVEEETIVNNKYGITVLPNPANTELNIFFGNNQTISHCKLFDSNGKLLLQINNSTNTLQKTIDVSKFDSGLYFIVFTNEQNQVLETKKFVVQH